MYSHVLQYNTNFELRETGKFRTPRSAARPCPRPTAFAVYVAGVHYLSLTASG
jgi:hypothetical protein